MEPSRTWYAVEENLVVGHILFTKAIVNNVEVLALAPLSVLPEYQNKGIGLDGFIEYDKAFGI